MHVTHIPAPCRVWRLRPQTQQPASCNATNANCPGVFRYRYFDIAHGDCAQKVGTDAMILGSWAEPGASKRILDVGTGTGVLALMMAQKVFHQRNPPHDLIINAIDIDPVACHQARINAAASPWHPHVSVIHASLQQLTGMQVKEGPPASCRHYDMAISNPPFFLHSTKPAKDNRALARHADMLLPYEDLCSCLARLLVPGGCFFLVLPPTEAQLFCALAEKHNFRLVKLLKMHTRRGAPAKRHFMKLVLMPEVHTYTPMAEGDSSRQSADTVHTGQLDSMLMAAPHGTDCTGSYEACVHESQLVLQNEPYVNSDGKTVVTFTEEYFQLTQDFHHPNFFQRL